MLKTNSLPRVNDCPVTGLRFLAHTLSKDSAFPVSIYIDSVGLFKWFSLDEYYGNFVEFLRTSSDFPIDQHSTYHAGRRYVRPRVLEAFFTSYEQYTQTNSLYYLGNFPSAKAESLLAGLYDIQQQMYITLFRITFNKDVQS